MCKYFVIWLWLSPLWLCAQEHSFELHWGDNSARDGIGRLAELPDQSYLVGCSSDTNWHSHDKASVFKINRYGEIIGSHIFDAEDSSTTVSELLYYPAQQLIIAFGSKSDTNKFIDPVMFIMVWDMDFNVVSYKEYVLPEPYHGVALSEHVIKPNGNIVFAGSIREVAVTNWGDFYLMECTPWGDTIKTAITPDEGPLTVSAFMMNPDSVSYTIVGKINTSSSMQHAIVDSNLNVVEVITVPLFGYVTPLTSKRLNEEQFFTSYRKSTTGTEIGDEIQIMRHNQQGLIYNTYIYVHPDTADVPFWRRGMSFIDPNFIFLGGILNVSGGNLGNTNIPREFVVVNLDENLVPRWERRYGGDYFHEMTAILATSDGGCIVVGGKSEALGSPTNFYVLKLNSQGLLSTENEKRKEYDIAVYPNPGRNELNIESELEGMDFMLYDAIGNRVLSQSRLQHTAHLSTHLLPQGVYFYRLYKDKEIVHRGKWIKL